MSFMTLSDLTPETAESLCDQFNKMWPVGSSVFLIKDFGEVVETTVKWPAGVTVNGPMVGLKCTAGSWLLSRVVPISEK